MPIESDLLTRVAIPAQDHLRVLSLCTGLGGLDRGFNRAFPTARTVCYVEYEASVACVLAARIQDGLMHDAPIWSDLRAFDGTPWHSAVDCVLAGFSCQPSSLAGRRKAQHDDRWIWPDIERIIRQVGPGLVALENVPGILTAGHGSAFGDVLGSLASLGFDAEWGCVGADDVGAPHIRKRIFVLASTNESRRGTGIPPVPGQSQPHPVGSGKELANPTSLQFHRQPSTGTSQVGRCREGVADTSSTGLEGWALQPDPQRAPAERGSGAVVHTDRNGMGQSYSEVTRRDDTVRSNQVSVHAYPPGPDGDWSEFPPHLYPVCPQSDVRRDPDGALSRMVRLQAIGNGCVPDSAAAAFRILRRHLNGD